MHHHLDLVSFSDLFAAGTGFDFAGAILLAKGLLAHASDFSHRLTWSRNTLSWANVRAAEDRADGMAGVTSLCLGFTLQATAYVIVIGRASPRTGGAWAYAIAGLCAVSAVVFTFAVALLTRWPRIRKFLVELAHYDRGRRHALPDLHELRMYGQILKRGPIVLDEVTGREEDPLEYARRVWKVEDGRGFGHHPPA